MQCWVLLLGIMAWWHPSWSFYARPDMQEEAGGDRNPPADRQTKAFVCLTWLTSMQELDEKVWGKRGIENLGAKAMRVEIIPLKSTGTVLVARASFGVPGYQTSLTWHVLSHELAGTCRCKTGCVKPHENFAIPFPNFLINCQHHTLMIKYTYERYSFGYSTIRMH